MRLVIASRKSDLARIQSYAVGDALKKKFPDLEVRYEFRESLGDKNLNDPLWKMPEKGVFTEDFYQGLVTGKWDMVVHSWKDLPVEERPDTMIAATMKRADVRDILLFKKSSIASRGAAKNLKILTSSPRRVYNLGACLEDLLPFDAKIKFDSVRGNVQTRVRKLLESDADGLILAKAGLDRLLSADRDEFSETQTFLRRALEELQWMVLPVSLNPTAAAQGALAIEVGRSRHDVHKLLNAIHCESTFRAVSAERSHLQGWGGGCHQKIGVNILPRDYGTVFMARGLRDTGEIIDETTLLESQKVTGTFQPDVKSATWFERQTLPTPDAYKKANAHWIARAVALPSDVALDPETNIIWTSGVESWKRLARRGQWVHGTSDSMGEQEDPAIATIDKTARQWVKWTHAEGDPFVLGSLIGTYRLVPKTQVPKLEASWEHFYWMSGSSFERALETYPWLAQKTNWSGPGNTHKRLQKLLDQHGGSGRARIALNLEQWQKQDTSYTAPSRG